MWRCGRGNGRDNGGVPLLLSLLQSPSAAEAAVSVVTGGRRSG